MGGGHRQVASRLILHEQMDDMPALMWAVVPQAVDLDDVNNPGRSRSPRGNPTCF
jgi:hypothetical protein